MTLAWFVIWLVANNVGAHEPLAAAPLNAWAATLILAVALDLNRPSVDLGRTDSKRPRANHAPGT